MKNNKSYQLVVIGIITLGIVLTSFFLGYRKTPNVLGSIATPDSYYSTTTPYAGTINGVGGVVLLKGNTTSSSQGMLGSVIVTGGPKVGSMALFDATTSNVNLRTGNLATSSITLAEFPAGTASSTYIFDTTFINGLLLVTSGTPGTTTITWK